MRYTVPRKLRKQDKKFPNLQDLFSLDDICLAQRVCNTHHTGYSRIALCAEDQKYNIGCSTYTYSYSNRWRCLTLKLKYAIDVWTKAILISNNNPGELLYYWWIHWADNETSFRHLEYSNFYNKITVEELLEKFLALLKNIADSGEIKVSESAYIYTENRSSKWIQTPDIITEVVLDSPSGKDVYNTISNHQNGNGQIFDYPFDKTLRSFKWDEIKDMFIELTLDQLRLVQKEQMHKCTSLDETLFNACGRLDIEGVRHAIELGANVNALNENGNSPITETIRYSSEHFVDFKKRYSEEEYQELASKALELSKPIVQLLLDHGADIDLFGFDGMQPLLAAYYDHNVNMTDFLLQNGSNPNYNSYLCDIASREEKVCISSSVLHCLYEEIDDYTPEEKEIEKLVMQYGGRLCNWGFSIIKQEYIGKYMVSLEPLPNLDPFIDGNSETIGNEESITVENKDGIIEVIDLSGIKGLKEWHEQYQQHSNDKTYDWNDWRDRGLIIAKEIAKLLPDYVSFRYLRSSRWICGRIYDDSCTEYNGREPIIIK